MLRYRLLMLGLIASAGVAVLTALAQTGGSGGTGGTGTQNPGTGSTGTTGAGTTGAGTKDSGVRDGGGKDSPRDAGVKDGGGQKDKGVRTNRDVVSPGTVRGDGTNDSGFKEGPRSYTGRVARIDVDKRTVALKDIRPIEVKGEKDVRRGEVVTFRVGKDARITLDGAAATLGVLKPDAYAQVIPSRAKSGSAGAKMLEAATIEAFTRDPGPSGTGGGGAVGGTGVTGGVGRDKAKER